MDYTVIIPAYNAGQTIAQAIESALRQEPAPAGIIVVDDGSTDETRKLAESFDACVRVLSQPNCGPGAATSLGISHCITPIIAGLDADDLWLPGKMERQLGYLAANESCAGVFSRMQHFGESIDGTVVQDGWGRTTMVLRRQLFDVVGTIVDPPGMRGEMVDWIARAREAGFELTLLPEVLARRRVSDGSLSRQRDAAKDRGYAHVARAALLRKRARLQGPPCQ